MMPLPAAQDVAEHLPACSPLTAVPLALAISATILSDQLIDEVVFRRVMMCQQSLMFLSSMFQVMSIGEPSMARTACHI